MEIEIDIVTILTAKPAYQQALGQALMTYAELSLLEDGCLAYHMSLDKNQPPRFVITERWRDHDSFLNHEKSDVFQNLASDFEGFLEEPLLSVFSTPFPEALS
ncbi:MAG: antibiotic biosynthesis monooxygenase family protein [Zymomonas mobilis subsp. pomaceae]|uniref:Antibiotic biosynthesis monooxygenase n=1 Tax=Zymomonas mobilis subsp. pomaceae (strain ATCC 29192 / DSM 22645 / JCM 10191 / CCUG 17912 / NBRC 13757 / NCIMB 11200 / NRRL B-4491 / Barker I) TaxID=579138 RepID=F8ETM5_ZYMMT|nr:antibiotic biosynthesis monooxygenase family protein [Zymomonas mobilis]AEI37035.1 Antibiotic biosynthesis monooxygenase [Zymomonas mobilis subsp. pomaceae ATCC 29192]MDX5948407.1 antibiotic biosynthesis monooxygenase family protein [Zymomonas mobilis subsp. pomaceae]GEB89603.1 hypothetical protein ZMO02_12400 [Zymomonas mobilis subsp. pomaceae]